MVFIDRQLGRLCGHFARVVRIGANTAGFSVLNGVLLKPLPYPDADRLVWLKHQGPGIDIANLGSSPYLYFIEREQSRAFDGVGLWGKGTVSVTGSSTGARDPRCARRGLASPGA